MSRVLEGWPFWRQYQIPDPVGQGKRAGVAELEGGGIVQGLQLPVHRLGDLRAVVPGAAAPQAGQAVQHLAAAVVGEVDAVGGDDDPRIRLELAVAGKGHPVGFELLAAESLVDGMETGHGGYTVASTANHYFRAGPAAWPSPSGAGVAHPDIPPKG